MRIVFLLLLAIVPAGAANRIGAIDFFGYKGIDVEAVRAALPVQSGAAFDLSRAEEAGEILEKIAAAVEKTTGHDPTDISTVCCIGDADWMIFIGLAGSSSKPLTLRPEPQGPSNLPATVLALHGRVMEAMFAALQKGGDAATEDRTQGYALSRDERMRTLQLELRAWAVEHEAEIFAGLDASQVSQREVAAMALGYANRSTKQIEGLMQAARDPSSDVRNAATRALDVLIASEPALVRTLDSRQFIAMLQSGIWTDRNKAVWLIDLATASPNEALADRLRSEGLDALREMAAWKSEPHGESARKILERIGAR